MKWLVFLILFLTVLLLQPSAKQAFNIKKNAPEGMTYLIYDTDWNDDTKQLDIVLCYMSDLTTYDIPVRRTEAFKKWEEKNK